MTTLSKRLPMFPRLQSFSHTPHDVIRPYLGWQLLEIDAEASEILICKPCCGCDEHTRSKHLLILSGRLARVWLRSREVAPA